MQNGNPFYPFFPGSVPREGRRRLGRGEFPRHRHIRQARAQYGDIWNIVALPLRLFFSGQDDNPQYFDGVLTPLLILLLPWVFTGKWSEDKKLLASFSLLSLLYALFLVDLRVRYVLSIVPPLAILAVYGVFNIYARSISGDFICRPLAVRDMAWRISVEVCCGGRSMALSNWRGEPRWLSRTNAAGVSDVSLYQPRNARACENLSSLYRRAYYCQRNYFHDGGELPGFLLAAIRNAKDIAQLEQSLRGKQITHLMLREDLLQIFSVTI